MSSKNVNSFSTIDTINTYSNSSLLGIVSGNLTRLTSGNLVLNQVNASNLVYNTGNQTISGIKTFASIPNVNGTGVFLSGESILATQISNSTSAGRTLLTSSVQSQRDALSIFPSYSSYQDLVLNGPKQTSRIYVTTDNWRTYAWIPTQSQYIEVSPSNLFINPAVNSDFSNLNGLTVQTSEWWNGVPTGWSGVNNTFTIYSGLGTNNYVANISQLSTGPSGNSFRQNLGRLPITSDVKLTFTLLNSFPSFGTPTLNAAIYDIDYNNLATGSYTTTTSGTFTLTGNSIPANTNIIVGFWVGANAPALDNVFVENTYTNVASVQDITTYSGFATGRYATITNLASTGSTLDTKINTLSGVSVLTFDNQTISGVKTFASRPTVNDTGVLLSGEGVFITTFTHDNTNMNNNTYHFANLQALDASVISTQRRVTMMQKCKAKYASWGTYTSVAREQDSTTNQSTGYFVNNTTNMSGIISTQIRHAANGTLAIFTGEITPNIDINFGDRVQLILRVPNYIIGMSGVSNSVDVTFLY
jgi:hypothetical protein